MKKLLLTLILPLIVLSSVSYGEELNGLFGITLYDNAEKYVSSNYIDSNKYKNSETIEGYFDLIVTDKIKTKSPYANVYLVAVDNDNIIHRIYGEQDFINLDICQAVRKDLLSDVEEKYQIDLKYKEKSFPSFKRYHNYYWTSSGNYLGMQCKERYSDSTIVFQIYMLTAVLDKAIDEFYDAGI